MTSQSTCLLTLARTILTHYASLPGAACAAVTGSVAEGHADQHSDLDMTVYYNSFPPEHQLRAVRTHLGGGALGLNVGNLADGELLESFRLLGVDCQIGHTTIARWEADIDRVLRGEELASPLHKAMSGTLVSIAITGEDLLEQWKRRLRDYPDSLARAMVEHHLKFFPVWGVLPRLALRDAAMWTRQALLESSFNVLGVLAGLNRKYFTTFQFKRAANFIETLELRPPDLHRRLDELWQVDLGHATSRLQELVREVVELVERHMPDVDTTSARRGLARDDKPWQRV